MHLGLACSVCGQLNTLRAQTCTRCGTVLAPAPVAPQPGMQQPHPGMQQPHPGMQQPQPGMQQPHPGMQQPHPGMQQPHPGMQQPHPGMQQPQPGMQQPQPGTQQPRFDPVTGQPLSPPAAEPPATGGGKTMFFGALQQSTATPRLVMIKGEGGDGVTYHLTGAQQTIGRSSGDIQFNDDVFLSPEHSRFTVQQGRLFVQDLNSVNGVFLRIKRPTPLDDCDAFLVGEQLLRVDVGEVPPYTPNERGTYFYGSPRNDAAFRITQLLAGGGEGQVCSARGRTLSIGREGNTLNFPQDRFISGHHAQLDVSSDTGQVVLTDTGSRNGTFVRLKGAQELFHGDYLFVGQQLFRVEIS